MAIIAALGLGTVGAAVITAVLTRRRERASQIRSRQDQANEKFRAKVTALNNHVVGGPVDKAIQTPHFAGLDEAIDGIQPLVEALIDECSAMTDIAERPTLLMAVKVMHLFPALAWQAAMLPGTNCEAARNQRVKAIEAMAALKLDMSAVMRADLGLQDIRPSDQPTPNWLQRSKDWLQTRRSGKPQAPDHLLRYTSIYEPLALSPVDREGSEPPIEWLNKWEVRSDSGIVPTTLDGYRVDKPTVVIAPDSRTHVCSAVAMKGPNSPWHLVFHRDTPAHIQEVIARDAVRLIAGNRHAFTIQLGAGWIDLPEGGVAHLWKAVPGFSLSGQQPDPVTDGQPEDPLRAIRHLHDPKNGVFVMTQEDPRRNRRGEKQELRRIGQPRRVGSNYWDQLLLLCPNVIR